MGWDPHTALNVCSKCAYQIPLRFIEHETPLVERCKFDVSSSFFVWVKHLGRSLDRTRHIWTPYLDDISGRAVRHDNDGCDACVNVRLQPSGSLTELRMRIFAMASQKSYTAGKRGQVVGRPNPKQATETTSNPQQTGNQNPEPKNRKRKTRSTKQGTTRKKQETRNKEQPARSKTQGTNDDGPQATRDTQQHLFHYAFLN